MALVLVCEGGVRDSRAISAAAFMGQSFMSERPLHPNRRKRIAFALVAVAIVVAAGIVLLLPISRKTALR